MKKKFYVDTCIWRDYFEDRKDNLKPLGEFAFQFLKYCENKGFFIIVSNAVKKELFDYYSEERLNQVFSSFKNLIIEISFSENQAKESFDFWENTDKKFPFFDILHSVIARDNKAILITRDRHFKEIKITECSLPEEIF